MKTSILLLIIIISSVCTFSQPGKKPEQQKPPSQSEINKMMEDAMKDLKPEEKAMLQEMMKNNTPMSGAASTKLIPDKQTALLARISKLTSEAQYKAFILKLQQQAEKSIDASIITAVKKLVADNKNDKTAINNLPILLLLQKQVEAAVYASILCSQQNQDIVLSQNNMGFILQQAGYPQYAIPVFEFQLTKNTNAILYNNTGQSYFSLGDTAKARIMFAACIRKDPNNAEAHCGTALMLIAQKKTNEAIPHIEKVLQNGYSDMLDDYVTKNNSKLNFDNIKKKNVTDYFSPQKYKPIPPAKTLKEVISRWRQLQEMEAEEQKWVSKALSEKETIQSANEKWAMQMAMRTLKGPFKRKAYLMLYLLQRAGQQDISARGAAMTGTVAKVETAMKKMNTSIELAYKSGGINSMFDACKMKEQYLVEYLTATIPVQESAELNLNQKYFDIVNQDMYWFKFLLNKKEYEAIHYEMGSQVMGWITKLSQIQRMYPEPINIATDCNKILDNPPKDEEMQEADGECPVTVKIPLGAGGIKFNCEGWEIEFTELIALSVEKNYKSGDFTVAFGLGASAELPGFEAGAKGQMYFTIDKDWTPSDMGLRGEVKGEVFNVINPVEEGVKGAIGISGVHVNAVHAGKDIQIFNYDPTK
jgi:tetratricopeptide (TPR) repeat protein